MLIQNSATIMYFNQLDATTKQCNEHVLQQTSCYYKTVQLAYTIKHHEHNELKQYVHHVRRLSVVNVSRHCTCLPFKKNISTFSKSLPIQILLGNDTVLS